MPGTTKPSGQPEPRSHRYAEAVLTRDLRAALVRLNPDLPAHRHRRSIREPDVMTSAGRWFSTISDFYQPHPQRRSRVATATPTATLAIGRARVIDFRQQARQQPLPGRARTEATGAAHAELQPSRRPRLLRQRPAAGLHRAEGGLQEHPRRLRRQPARLHGRERHRPRLPPQCVPDRQQRRPRAIWLDHQQVGPLRGVEAPRRERQGRAWTPRCCSNGMLAQDRLLDIVENFILFDESKAGRRARWSPATTRCSASITRSRPSDARRS